MTEEGRSQVASFSGKSIAPLVRVCMRTCVCDAQYSRILLRLRGSIFLDPTLPSETMSSEFGCLAGRHLATRTLIHSFLLPTLDTCVCACVRVCVQHTKYFTCGDGAGCWIGMRLEPFLTCSSISRQKLPVSPRPCQYGPCANRCVAAQPVPRCTFP